MAVKETARLIPMCHAIPVTAVEVGFEQMDDSIEVTVTVRSVGRTGVEMEALSGVSVALLTIWDMVKSAEKDPQGQYPVTRIDGIRVLRKQKG
jgi:cyclic pyranopterin phosphate synthase